ncbi:MAG: hypothetical protein CSA03_00480 [Bacteroidetes bacterium]|nr:MAG: hypothetical protein CSA03_00480 [Bacteroidota bacterium]
MDFQKKYPILQDPNEYILVQWTRGYRNVDVLYKNRLVSSISGSTKLKKGVRINDSELGLVELKLSEKPIAIDLKVDGYHSPVNVSYPTKELASVANIFIVLAVISVIGALYEGMSVTMWYGGLIGTIITVINVLSIAIYATTAALVKNGYAWAFFLGSSWYSLFTLFYVSDLFLSGFYLDTFFIAALRIVVTIILAYYLRNAIDSVRHKRYDHKKAVNPEVIDSL